MCVVTTLVRYRRNTGLSVAQNSSSQIKLILESLLGVQGGCTKYLCCFCLRENRTVEQHLVRREWPLRGSLEHGKNNVINQALIPVNKILLPPLHIKLAPVKQLIKH